MIARTCLPKFEEFFGNIEKKFTKKTEEQIEQEEMDKKRLEILMDIDRLNEE